MFGIKQSTWNSWVNDGVIAKAPVGKYDPVIVYDQIIKYKDSLVRKSQNALNHKTNENNRLKQRLASVEANGGDIHNGKPLSKKEKLDIRLAEKKVEKMEMDASIRMKQYLPNELLVKLVIDIATSVNSGLDPIAPLIKRSVPDLPSSVFTRFEKDLAKLRNELAQYECGDKIEEYLESYEPKGYFDDSDD